MHGSSGKENSLNAYFRSELTKSCFSYFLVLLTDLCAMDSHNSALPLFWPQYAASNTVLSTIAEARVYKTLANGKQQVLDKARDELVCHLEEIRLIRQELNLFDFSACSTIPPISSDRAVTDDLDYFESPQVAFRSNDMEKDRLR